MESVFKLVLATAGVSTVTAALAGVRDGLGKVAGVAATVSGSLGSIKAALKIGAELEHLSLRTGQTVQDISLLQSAFKKAGLDGDKLATSVAKLHKAIDTAISTTKEFKKEFKGIEEEGYAAGDAFTRLGLSAAQLKNLTARQQFEQLAAAFQKIPTPVERSALAMKIFGKAGAELIQLFAKENPFDMPESASRMAHRLQDNAATFEKLDRDLGAINSRLKEMWMVAAEKLTPALSSVAGVLKGINLGPAGAAIGTGSSYLMPGLAIAGAIKTNKWLWDAAGGGADYPGLKAGITRSLSSAILPFTGALARALPVGLIAATAFAVAQGIHAAWTEWQDEKLDRARTGFDALRDIEKNAREVRSDEGRQEVINQAIAARNKIAGMLRDEQGSFFKTDQSKRAIASYKQQLEQVAAFIRMLSGEWGKVQVQTNLAKDAAETEADREKSAAEWLAGAEGQRAREKRTEVNLSKLSLDERLRSAQFELDLLNDAAQLEQKRLEKADSKNQSEVFSLRVDVERARILEQVLDLEKKIAQRKIDTAKNTLEDQLAKIGTDRAKLDADFTRTDQEKFNERKRNLAAEIQLQEKYIDTIKAARMAATTEDGKAAYDSSIRSGVDKLVSLRGQDANTGPNPNSFSDQFVAAMTQARQSMGTMAQQMASLWANTGESIRTSLGNAFYSAIRDGGTFKEKAGAFALSVADTFAQHAAQMAADWIYEHTVMAAVKAAFHAQGVATQAAATGTEVGIHAAGEAAKTGATAAGAGSRGALRVGETIFHGIQVVIRTAAHIAGEVAQTAVTLAQKAIRLPLILAESAAYLAKAAIGAMSAMASIPYVGPILAVAAMAAIIAAGSKLMKGFSEGGYTGGGSPGGVAGVVHGQEFVFSAPAVRNLGRENLEVVHRSAKTGSPMGVLGGGSGPSGGGPIYIGFYPSREATVQGLRDRPGRKYLMEHNYNTRAQIGINT